MVINDILSMLPCAYTTGQSENHQSSMADVFSISDLWPVDME